MKKIICLFIVVFAILTFFVFDCIAGETCYSYGLLYSSGQKHYTKCIEDCPRILEYIGIGASICIVYSYATYCYSYSYNYDTCTDYFTQKSGLMYDCGGTTSTFTTSCSPSLDWGNCI